MSQFTGHFSHISHSAEAYDENTSHSAEAYDEVQIDQSDQSEQFDQSNQSDQFDSQSFTTDAITTHAVALSDISSVIAYLLYNNPGDGLIPNQAQVTALQSLISDGVIPESITSRQWHNALWADNGGVLFQTLDQDPVIVHNIFDDQMIRARALVAKMIKKDISNVCIMDGHGRFLLCLMHALIEVGKSPDDYNIMIVENDPICQEWHRLFFPNVDVTLNNVLHLLRDTHISHLVTLGQIPYPTTYQLPFNLYDLTKTIFYLNFCSIGQSVNDFGHERFVDLLHYYAPFDNLMLSFSVRAMTRDGSLGNLVNYHIRPYWKFICSRGNFVSGFIRNIGVVAAPVVEEDDEDINVVCKRRRLCIISDDLDLI